MNYIEKLFKQKPFVYKIQDEYYAFGTGVCSKIPYGKYITLESRFQNYLDLCDGNGSREEAYDAFLWLASVAETERDANTAGAHPIASFNRMPIEPEEITDLNQQIDQYIKYIHDYKLSEYVNESSH